MSRRFKGSPVPDWLALAIGAVLVLAVLLALVQGLLERLFY